MFENKIKKYTYIRDPLYGDYTYGCRVEKTTYQFENSITVPEYFTNKGARTETKTLTAENWDNPDVLCYNSYSWGGAEQYYSTLSYGGVAFQSV